MLLVSGLRPQPAPHGIRISHAERSHLVTHPTKATARVGAAALLLLATLVGLVGSAATAHAAGPVPPWEPDPSSIGGLVFYNAAGTEITTGSINDAPFAKYVRSTAAGRPGDTKATLFAYTPVEGVPIGSWSGGALTASTNYPNASAPEPVKSSTFPVATVSSADLTLAQFIATFPNNAATGAYQGLYQLRIKTSGPGQPPGATYASADIKITGTTWTLVYPDTSITGSKFHPLAPVRVLDSRTGNGWSGKLAQGSPRALQVTGLNTVPATADAVVLNVTATAGSNNSFITAFPTGGSVPTASNVNFAVGQTIPNLVTVKIGTGGQVSFANAVGSVDVIADLVGYYDPVAAGGDRFNPLAPVRALDSRTGTGWSGKLVQGTPRALQLTGANGVPNTADAAVLNVTATGGSANSFLTAFPTGGSVPTASNLNFAVGQTIPNLVTVKIGTGGQVSFANAVGSVDVVADLVGYFDSSTGDYFHVLPPTRALDSRTGNGWSGKLASGAPRELQITGANGVPAGADAVIANTTATAGTANSFITVYPTGGTVPTASNLNFATGETIPNLVTAKIGTGGKISFANAVGAVDVIADIVGYYATS